MHVPRGLATCPHCVRQFTKCLGLGHQEQKIARQHPRSMSTGAIQREGLSPGEQALSGPRSRSVDVRTASPPPSASLPSACNLVHSSPFAVHAGSQPSVCDGEESVHLHLMKLKEIADAGATLVLARLQMEPMVRKKSITWRDRMGLFSRPLSTSSNEAALEPASRERSYQGGLPDVHEEVAHPTWLLVGQLACVAWLFTSFHAHWFE